MNGLLMAGYWVAAVGTYWVSSKCEPPPTMGWRLNLFADITAGLLWPLLWALVGARLVVDGVRWIRRGDPRRPR